MYKITAAHKLLPMHTRIHVTNLENGKSVTLTVNDRGPFEPGRIIDVSYGAAKKLAMIDQGLARVQIHTSRPVEGQKNNDLVGEFFVHIGSFESQKAARSLLEDMKSNKYKPSMIKIVRADRSNEVLYRVEVGPYKSMSVAEKAHTKIITDYPSAFVVAK
jgi:rare lipoprotein A